MFNQHCEEYRMETFDNVASVQQLLSHHVPVGCYQNIFFMN